MKKTLKNIERTCFLLLKPNLKMKLTYFFFLVSFFQIYANGYGQNTKVTLDLDNVSVEQVFEQIEQITDYRFLYNIKNLNLNRKVSLNADKEPLNKVLLRLFKSTNIEFKLLENQIVLKAANSKGTNSKKIQKQISGIVTDESGLPLPGVTIIVAGTQRGVATDFDGSYSIEALTGDILVFNYLGYTDYELTIGDDAVYNVKMVPSSLELDQVFVSTGYQTISRERVTGAFGTVGNKILDTKIDQNILSKIANETPGLLSDTNEGFLVRGISTIGGQRTPLIVIDGIALPLGSRIEDINPNDVKSINVLKDAAASSIWGIKAASGVIVIVTKRGGRNSKTTIEASTNTSITSKVDIFDTNIAGPATQVDFQKSFFDANNRNSSVDDLFSNPSNILEDSNQFFQLNPVLQTLLELNNGNIDQSQANTRLNNLSTVDAREEFSRRIIRPTIWNQYNLAISGGGEKQDFRASFTLNNNRTGLRGVKSNQIIANLTNSIDLSDKLSVNFVTNFSQSLAKDGPSQINDGLNILPGDPTTPFGFLSNIPLNTSLVDDAGNYVPQVLGANQGFSDFLLSRGLPYDYTYNVLQEYDNANNTTDNLSLRLQAELNYEFTKGLDLSLTYRYQLNAREVRNLYNENTFATRHRVNLFAQIDPSTNSVNNPETDFVINRGSILDNTFFRSASHTLRSQLNFDKGFNDGLHYVSAIVGLESSIFNTETDSRRLYGYNDVSLKSQRDINFSEQFTNAFQNAPFLTSNVRVPFGDNNLLSINQDREYSYYANAAYTYDDKYTISGSTRLDDTDFFGASEEFRNKPSYSLGLKWDVYQDLFYSSNAINSLYLRGSYGVLVNTGDKEAGRFLTVRVPGRLGSTFGNQFAQIDNIPNNLLQLEKVRKTNFGLDFGLFKNFISGSVDYYSEVSEDLFSVIAFNPTLGISSQNVNSGELINKGVDVVLNLDFSKPNSQFSYNTTFNFSLNKNELTQVEFDNSNIASHLNGTVTRLGKPISTIFSYRYAGLDTNGEPQYFDRNGDILALNTNDDVNITESEDLIEQGTLVPEYYGSWVNNFKYKNFSLRVLTSFKAGHVFRYNNRFIPGQFGDVTNVTKDFSNRWQVAGDENNTSIPRIPESLGDGGLQRYRNYANVDAFVDDASHIRLNQINLGYNLPSPVLNTIGFDTFRISLQLDNVAVWSFNKWDVDPENQFFPLQRTLSFNINTKF
ncbi:SusC/RagA family TonB-linked outer membrane protein [uncultured Algibacter sp.]|uniref:SusC/RagA family TonB-linked outer membrane protein n=1 Tax=uncultured Algibacter sp. TaxID=298659 RepID=UPI003216DC48